MNIYKVITIIIMITFKKAFPDCRPIFNFVCPEIVEFRIQWQWRTIKFFYYHLYHSIPLDHDLKLSFCTHCIWPKVCLDKWKKKKYHRDYYHVCDMWLEQQYFQLLLNPNDYIFLNSIYYYQLWKNHNDLLIIHIWLHIQLCLQDLSRDMCQICILSKYNLTEWIFHYKSHQDYAKHFLNNSKGLELKVAIIGLKNNIKWRSKVGLIQNQDENDESK